MACGVPDKKVKRAKPDRTSQAQRADLRQPRAIPWESMVNNPMSPERAAQYLHERLPWIGWRRMFGV